MNARALAWLAALGLCALAGAASAHEVRPAYLQLREAGAGSWDVLWKVPARGGNRRIALDPVFPQGCADAVPHRAEFSDGAYREWSTLRCASGMDGARIRVDGLAATRTDVLVRVERADGRTQTARLVPDAPGFVVEASPAAFDVATTYLKLGAEHILLGVDHLLFVLALLLLVEGVRRLVATVTAFTVAHSITLAGATLGWVRLPGPPVEACIALSIVFVAREIVHARQGRPSLAATRPWSVAFTFGLLHGFGFAGALHEVGLPQTAVPMALAFFNLGVEAGQLAFVAVVLAAAAAARRLAPPAPPWAWRVPPYAIGCVASFWLIERLATLAG